MLWWRGQRLIRDSITDGEFRKYGLQVASMMEEDPEDRIDPMSRIFPRMTKCTFNKFGPGGTLQRRDALCVLPVNIINEVRPVPSSLSIRYTWPVKLTD